MIKFWHLLTQRLEPRAPGWSIEGCSVVGNHSLLHSCNLIKVWFWGIYTIDNINKCFIEALSYTPMITLTYKSKSTLAQSCGWSARHSSHCQNLPRGLRRKFKYPTFLSRAWLRLPDHSRSHIGPNAGGSLNLSNWTMELIQLSRSKFYNTKIILNIFNKYHSCLIWMSKQFWMMRPESWLNRKKCRFSHCLQIRGKDGDLSTFLMSSSVWISGLSPPWTQRNCWFIRAARGRQSKASMQASYTRSVYLILPKQILSRGF